MLYKTILLGSLFVLMSASCQDKPSHSLDSGVSLSDPFVSDVIGVTTKHISEDYWLQQANSSHIIMTTKAIDTFNTNISQNDPTMFDLQELPQALSRDELNQRLRSISKISKYKRIYSDGTLVTNEDFARYEANLNLKTIEDTNSIRFAIAVRRTSLRTYPTSDLLFSEGASNRDIERFQETALFPADIVAVLHESTDGQWVLVQSYNYIAWAQKKDIAYGNRDEIFAYSQAKDFLVITGSKVYTTYNPEVSAVSEVQLDMGVKLPLDRPQKYENNLYGQNPYLSHMVLLPVRTQTGTVEFKHALIARNQDVHVGYLSYTETNVITQAFKFLGERYGWGHRYNGRDCTGFVSEIYKSFGIQLPRNSGDQGKGTFGENLRFDKPAQTAAKTAALKNAKVGDLIYIPGHVMMYLGQSDGQPFVIHDVAGLGYLNQDGDFYKGTLNGVSITPIIPLRTSKERSFLDAVYNIKTIR